MKINGDGKLIIFSAPSGAGKTTIVKALMERFPQMEFSISATSRAPRGNEKHGHDYYFMTNEEFERAVAKEKFVEWEEVYAGTSYGTLITEVERIWEKGSIILFDVDVKGGIALKKLFGRRALSIFVMPPSIEELENRLVNRGTDSREAIARRLAKATLELRHADQFDYIVVNDNLNYAIGEVELLIEGFIKGV